MKWYSVKKYQPSYDGFYFVRYRDHLTSVTECAYVLYNGKHWCDFDRDNDLFQGIVTHFSMPEPVEIEE
jgi:hypothetical protein